MIKPIDYELKKWLCDNIIIGCKVHYYQTGTDTSDTDWEIFTKEGGAKRLKRDMIMHLIRFSPDWIRLFAVEDCILREVEAYRNFAKREAKDLAEYNRLKKKFEA